MYPKPIIKICGNPSLEAVEKIQPLKPDWWGFIFYKSSKRFFASPPCILQSFKTGIKVGVFVNAPIEEVTQIAQSAGLDYVQLHGDESPEFCKSIATQIPVIKAIGIGERLDHQQLKLYAPYVDYFLFDTLSPLYGGTGKKFDRTIITQHYTLDKPYLMSGGIDTTEAISLLGNPPPLMAGLDMNSKLEISPGEKDNQLIQQFLKQVYAT